MNAKTILQFSMGPVGAAILSLITLPFVAWFFSVEDVGRLTMLQVILGLAVSLFSLAMHQAYVREYHEEEDKSALLKLSIIPGFVLLIFISLFILVLPFSISSILFGIDSNLITFLLFTGLFATFFINFLAHVIRMQERGLAFSATQIAPKIFLLILISLIMSLNWAAEFKTLMLMNTLSVVFSLFIFSWLTRDSWLISITKSVDFVLLKQMLLFSLPLVAGGLAYWGLTTMDRFFLRSLSGFNELGVYALAVALAGVVSVLTSIFSSLWHPVLYKWTKEGIDENKVQRVIENMILVVASFWSLAGLLSFIVPFFLPPQYLAIEYLIVACVSMPLFYLLSETTGVGIGITRRTSFAMFASIVAFLINAILNYLLIPVYGSSGAALASMASFFMFFVIKTEASAFLWRPFPRFKIYFILVFYMFATCVVVLAKAHISNFYIVWLILLLLTCGFFAKRLIESVNFFKIYFGKEN
ncbi:lipopolysaccharide biosynthesis protein [Pseudoalteromonas sp. SWYJZ12]|uniref:lipopolysaccharide biosynthesis protein n=1 Tax=Pseudoalteromonas sp. SWYJZ12 TaxID=2792067 RepID=UPI0018CF9F5B|nr:oligosaccharide flippase family protein [Pseudoalteromonas sp. SWYJZ12]MBH0002707.1 oligosaccharide flippase family protein [Pseudoalteromonas sp. SWYJZ12]